MLSVYPTGALAAALEAVAHRLHMSAGNVPQRWNP
jgi:hypothetical protein